MFCAAVACLLELGTGTKGMLDSAFPALLVLPVRVRKKYKGVPVGVGLMVLMGGYLSL